MNPGSGNPFSGWKSYRTLRTVLDLHDFYGTVLETLRYSTVRYSISRIYYGTSTVLETLRYYEVLENLSYGTRFSGFLRYGTVRYWKSYGTVLDFQNFYGTVQHGTEKATVRYHKNRRLVRYGTSVPYFTVYPLTSLFTVHCWSLDTRDFTHTGI